MVVKKSALPEQFIDEEKSTVRRQVKIKSIYRESEEKETSSRAKNMGYGYLDLNIIPVESESLKIVPVEKARKARIAVIHSTGKKLQTAIYDPESEEAKKAVKELSDKGYDVSPIMVSLSSLEKAWAGYDMGAIAKPAIEQNLSLSEKDLSDFEKSLADLTKLAEKITGSPVSESLNIILAGAIKTNSSDIHLEPTEDSVRVRYRIDGILQDMALFPKKIYAPLLSRIKMLGRLKLNVSGIPQNGRLTVKVAGDTVDIRLAVLPGVYGDDIVMRLLYQNAASLSMENLGLRAEMFEIIKQQLEKPNGMILVTGPTGSGKTTTLYAFVNYLNEPGTKIITIEDPVEYKIAGISQTAVNPEGGYTFSTGLAAILRQDPDVIMVGEMRDPDTASAGIQAALTGHLVFSTLHTNDAPGAIPRMVELGIRPSLIPPSTNAIIGQRLVRKLCPFCKTKYSPAPETLEKIQSDISAVSPKAKIKPPEKIEYIWEAKGCPKCNMGYKGRIGIFEIFTISPKIEKLIIEMSPASEISKAAQEEGMLTMRQDGLLKAIEGITTISEVDRTAGEE
jgi:type IV pilus assembly protein PilB